jgi:hypothetical protein
MKKLRLKIIIIIAILTSAFAFSQNLQPERILYNNNDGVFITISIMDSISLKLIQRNFLIKENTSLNKINFNLSGQINALSEKSDLNNLRAVKYRSLFELTEQQKSAALQNFESQKIITGNVRKKARRNGLLFMGGGFSLGFLAFAVLVR